MLAALPVLPSRAQPGGAGFRADVEKYAVLHTVVVQPDGGYVVVGRQLAVGAEFTGHLARFRADGSLDTEFQRRLGVVDLGNVYSLGASVLAYPDGRLLLANSDGPTQITGPRGTRTGWLIRLLANGRVDSSFAAPNLELSVQAMALQPDGKLVVGGRSALGLPMVQRLLPNGALDAGFQTALRANRIMVDVVTTLAVQPDGKIVAGGSFLTPASGLVRLLPSGATDPAFDAAATKTANIQEIQLTPAGQLLVAGPGTTTLHGQMRGLHRLAPDGKPDPAFQAPAGYDFVTNGIGRLVLQLPADELLVFPYNHATVPAQRLLANGQPAPGFAADARWPLRVASAALDANGHALLVGTYRHSAGPQGTLLRMRPDGRLDSDFHPQLCEPGTVLNLQPHNGGVVLVGSFDKVQNQRAAGVARLLATGLLDTAFARRLPPLSGSPDQLAVQPGGRLVVGGLLQTWNPPTRYGIVALQPDGSLDLAFRAGLNLAMLHSLAAQPDGKLLIAGQAARLYAGREVARLWPDGSWDNTFAISATASDWLGSTTRLCLQPDGKLLAAGRRLLRLLPTGQLDVGFSTPTLDAYPALLARDMVVQPDGRILICGQVPDGFNQRGNLVRLLPSGAHDYTLTERSRADHFDARTVLPLPNQKLLLGGYWGNNSGLGGAYLGLYPLAADGQYDSDFELPEGSGAVLKMLLRPEGHLYLGGNFLTAPLLQQSLVRVDGPVTVTSGKQPVEDGLHVYPNPARQTLTVRWPSALRPQQVQLLDMAGRQVATLRPGGGTSTSLAVHQLRPGLYLLRLELVDAVLTRRVEVQ